MLFLLDGVGGPVSLASEGLLAATIAPMPGRHRAKLVNEFKANGGGC